MLRRARRSLASSSFSPPTREAQLLLARVLGRGEASVLAHPEAAVSGAEAARFEALLARRLDGEPVAYLLSEREFYGRPFFVDRRVLIPRPETEHLIEAALAVPLPARPRVVDVGTGSGCIAATLAAEVPAARVVATDLSLPALRVATSNLARHGLKGRVVCVHADLLGGLDLGRIDLLLSNPPYIDREAAATLSHEVTDFEPHAALFAPGRGPSVIERLLDETVELRPGVRLIVEIGHDQSAWLEAAVASRAEWEVLEIVRDYRGVRRTAVLERVVS